MDRDQSQADEVQRPKAEIDNAPEVMTLPEAATYLRYEPGDLRRLASLGLVPGRAVEAEWRFSRNALNQWLIGDKPSEKHWGDGNESFRALIGAGGADDEFLKILENLRAGANRERTTR